MKLLLHFPQNVQTNRQYLKFDNIYASTKTFACSSVRKLRIRKKSFYFVVYLAANIFNMTF